MFDVSEYTGHGYMAFDESVCALPEMGGDFQNPDEEHQEAVAERTGEE